MRPVTLKLDGFRSYASEVEIDWTGRHLVGIVGPIGSGKSTILDAVCFALYGKTPTEKANQRSLIHQRADVGKVELVFDVEGIRWKSVRALRRRGQSPHALYRIDPDDPDGEPLETILGKGDVDARIEEILGVDFDGFNRSVMLAQGRFSDFLKAGNADRDKTLKGVFGLDKIDVMEAVAKRIRDEAKRDLDEFGRRKADLDNVRALAARAEEALENATKRLESLWLVEADLAEADQQRQAEQAKIEKADERTAALKSIAARMPDPGRSREILSEHAARQAELALAKKHLESLTASSVTARQKRAHALESVGGEAQLAVVRQQAARYDDAQAAREREVERLSMAGSNLEKAESLVTQTRAEADKAVAGAQAAAAVTLTASDALRGSEQAVHEGQHADMAATLRADLAVGHECPVCAQPVAELPKAGRQRVALDQLETDRDTARRVHEEAVGSEKIALAGAARSTEAVTNAITKLEEAKASVAAATDSKAAAAAMVVGIESTLSEVLGEEPIARLATVEATLKAATNEIDELEAALAGARSDVEHGAGAVEKAQADLRALASVVVTLASQLQVDHDDVVDADGTEKLLALVRDIWVRNQQEASKERELAVAGLAGATRGRAEAMESVGLSPDDDFGKALANAVAAVAATQRELDLRKERLAQSAELDEQITARESVVGLYDDLAKDLRPGGFLGYLLEEERAELATVASEQFEQLSGGRYRFSDGGEFNILDLNAAELVRKASSLSGGETFLASLALALALAEMVARGSGRLDAFFLDEGFGSLDAEHLDLAMAGIELLVAGHDERLVVIVSHVPDMKDRIEDLIILDKDPGTGATIVVGG
ncbi:MAG: SMC family ATPase [Acidimicrobiia bacterium]|nr:SMC family ATPase [Acidimicrobiia bacterium]